MQDDLTPLFTVLDRLATIARMMHPARLQDLIGLLGGQDAVLAGITWRSEQAAAASAFALQACAGLRGAPDADNPIVETFRAMRQYSRALEALAGLVNTVPEAGRYFLEPDVREDPAFRQEAATEILHFNNATSERGGFSATILT